MACAGIVTSHATHLNRTKLPGSALLEETDCYGYRHLVAAYAVGAADHGGTAFYRARNPEVFRVSERRLGPGPVARGSRLARVRWRHPSSDRLLYPNCRLHPVWRHGRGLFHGARAEKLFSAGQRGPASNSLLLCLFLPICCGRRGVERRRAALRQAVTRAGDVAPRSLPASPVWANRRAPTEDEARRVR